MKPGETPQTGAPVSAPSVRFVRTLDGDDEENPGLYLVLGPAEDEHGGGAWLVLALVGDPDIHVGAERDGALVVHGDRWLRDWTEPLP